MSIMKKALVLSLAVVLGLGFAAFAQGELSGEWDTVITITPDALTVAAFLDFETELTVTYSIGGWDFTSYTAIDDTGWVAQSFDAAGAFGAFNVASGLTFDTTGDFVSWTVDTSFTFGSVAIGIDFDLYDSDVRLCLSGAATTGLVDITINMCFGDLTFDADGNYVSGDDECDLDWAGIDITVEFPFCCADVTATLDITCDGFQEACFGVSGVAIPNLPWVTIDAEVCFLLETKTLTLSPVFDFGADVCFDLYICEVATGGVGPDTALVLGDFYIEGIGLTCEIGGVSFTGLSYWGDYCDLKPDALGDYWEMYQIATTEDACCGPFDFDIAVYFDAGGAALFDVAAFDANFSYELGDNFTFSMGLNYVVGAPGLALWTIGFNVVW
jgi:hypothetical protein